jgi:phosphoribosyl-ATP pyrophosphohydrolase/phosphoribosyl-AMP cyclohydrolase
MIVPSIDLMNGRAVQLRRGREKVLDGGDPLARLEELSVAGEVAVIDLDAALGTGSNAEMVRELVRRAPCRVGGGIRSIDTAREWLDTGAARVIIGTAATPEFCASLPSERLVAAVDAEHGELVVEGWQTRTGRDVFDVIRDLAPHVGGFLLTQVEHEGVMQGFDWTFVHRAAAVAGGARITAAGGITTAGEIAALDALGVDAQVGMALYTGALPLGDAIVAPLAARDPDGVWPTVVCDEHGTALGLVWSRAETLRRAVMERRGIYWSRSRGEVWVKGATSGNTQQLLRVDLDCDRDALRFTVRQEGSGFCHTGATTCWGDGFDLGRLEQVVASAVATGDPASGTVRLVRDPELLSAKLTEEAVELAQATTADEAVHETADLLYFALVALHRGGGTLGDVRRELERRHRRVTRRPMQAKKGDQP